MYFFLFLSTLHSVYTRDCTWKHLEHLRNDSRPEIYIYIYVGRKVWISVIHGLRCANHGSVLSATIHGSCISKGAKYKFADNPWIVLRAQTTNRLVCSQVQSKDKLQVSGIALAS